MRKVTPYFDDEPFDLWREASKIRKKSILNPGKKSKLEQALTQKMNHDFDRDIYGLPSVKTKLQGIFKCKCAFCETNTQAGAHKDVEHYRFKSHYYWLGYEWTNLLLSCQICNRDFKRIQFPLENEIYRVITHPIHESGTLDKTKCHILSEQLQNEIPLLLHPAIDDPKEHLKFLSDGSIQGLTVKGRKSIEVYGLDRQLLVKEREKIVFKITIHIVSQYVNHVEQLAEQQKQTWLETVIRSEIVHLKNKISEGTTQYIGFREAILQNFEEFIIDNHNFGIDMPDKDLMRQAVRAILKWQTPGASYR